MAKPKEVLLLGVDLLVRHGHLSYVEVVDENVVQPLVHPVPLNGGPPQCDGADKGQEHEVVQEVHELDAPGRLDDTEHAGPAILVARGLLGRVFEGIPGGGELLSLEPPPLLLGVVCVRKKGGVDGRRLGYLAPVSPPPRPCPP